LLFTAALPHQIDVAGATVEYLRQGNGRPLLYLHGFDGISNDDPLIAPLAGRFDLIAPSLPGFGASKRPRLMRTIEDLAHFGLNFAHVLGLKDAILAGSSFGGWLAAEIATKGSPHFSHLVLADPVGARFAADPSEKEILDIFTTETKHYPPLLFSDAAIADNAFNRMDFAGMDEFASLRFCTNREGLTQFGWAPLLHNPGLRARLNQIRLPTLVLWGADDRIVSIDYGRKFAGAIPGATLEIVAKAGHYLPIEQPEEFAMRTASFCAKSAAAA
jgi:pimeloyl-ACP methyl ester carboxylesterase